MHIQAAMCGRVQYGLRQDQAIRRHHSDIQVKRSKGRLLIL